MNRFVHELLEKVSLINKYEDPISKKVSNTDIRFEGIADNVIGFFVENYNIALEAGIVHPEVPGQLFITDGSQERTNCLMEYILNTEACEKITAPSGKKGTRHVDIYVPIHLKSRFQKLIESAFELTKNKNFCDIGKVYWSVKSIDKPTIIKANMGKREIIVENIGDGYGFSEYRNKLKAEYIDASQEELSELISKNVNISENRLFPMFCYFGKISQCDFEKYKDKISAYPVVMFSCEYITTEHINLATDNKCLNWIFLEDFVKTHNNIHFGLYNFSKMYDKSFITSYFPENVTPFINTYSKIPTATPEMDLYDIVMSLCTKMAFKEQYNNSKEFELIGISEAARMTAFYCRQMQIMFDAGLKYTKIIPVMIFITHCHFDHVARIPYYMLEAEKINRKIITWISRAMVGRLDKYIRSVFELAKNTDLTNVKLNWETLYPSLDQPQEFKATGKKYYLEPFKCEHPTPCTGFGISDIIDGVKHRKICYVGDTSDKLLVNQNGKVIGKYPVVVIECTYLPFDDLKIEMKNARESKHMHWNSLQPYCAAHPNTTFILCHFSPRYDPHRIKYFFETEVNMPNVIPFINTFGMKPKIEV